MRSFDDTPIRYGVFRREHDPTSALIFLNGRSEWIEKYSYLPTRLELPPSVAFVTLDHRGQGASGGHRADIDSFDTYVNDIQAVIKKVCPGLPYSIISHSTGSLMALYGTLINALKPGKLVLSSPLLGFMQDILKFKLMRIALKSIKDSSLGRIHHGVRVQNESPPFQNNPFTSDAEKYHLIENAPFRVPQPTYRWINACLTAMDTVFDKKLVEALPCPLLALVGSDERVVDADAIHRWLKLACQHARQDIAFKTIEGGRHELFFEDEHHLDPVIRAIKQWFPEIWP